MDDLIDVKAQTAQNTASISNQHKAQHENAPEHEHKPAVRSEREGAEAQSVVAVAVRACQL